MELLISVAHGRCFFYSCADTVASQQPAQLTNSSPSDDCAAPNGMLSNPELAIDEGTISLSSQYSQGYAPIMDPNKTFFFHTLIELSVFLCFCFSQCCFLVVFVVLEICIASQWEKIFHFFLMTGCLLRWILPFKTRVSICHKLASQCRSTLVRGLPRDLLLG